MSNENYIYNKFNFSNEYKERLVEFLRHNCNVEIGGYKIYDGIGNHLLQNPEELADPDIKFFVRDDIGMDYSCSSSDEMALTLYNLIYKEGAEEL